MAFDENKHSVEVKVMIRPLQAVNMKLRQIDQLVLLEDLFPVEHGIVKVTQLRKKLAHFAFIGYG